MHVYTYTSLCRWYLLCIIESRKEGRKDTHEHCLLYLAGVHLGGGGVGRGIRLAPLEIWTFNISAYVRSPPNYPKSLFCFPFTIFINTPHCLEFDQVRLPPAICVVCDRNITIQQFSLCLCMYLFVADGVMRSDVKWYLCTQCMYMYTCVLRLVCVDMVTIVCVLLP